MPAAATQQPKPPTAQQKHPQPSLDAIEKRYQELQKTGDHTAALEEARKLEAAASARFGTEHGWYAGALARQGHMYRALFRHAEAEQAYRRALPIWEKVRGPVHADVGWTLVHLGRVISAQGRHDEAEPFYTRGLAVHEQLSNQHAIAEKVSTISEYSTGAGIAAARPSKPSGEHSISTTLAKAATPGR